MSADLDAAWQAALAAEHQSIFGYGLLGPRLERADRQRAIEFTAAHEAVRDTVEAALAAAGVAPVSPLADYPALYPVADSAAARRLGVRLEDACAAAWRYLFAAAIENSGSQAATLRAMAQAQLTASAVRATRWRAVLDRSKATNPFPGI